MTDMAKAISNELILRSDDIRGQIINTIYLGGGTPSLLSEESFLKINSAITDYYQLSEDLEFTIELNPEDINKKNIVFWGGVGVNRYSLGIQSFVIMNCNG